MGWSPEQIAGRLRLEGSEHRVSHESIYRYIYRPKVRPKKLHRYLTRAKATRGRRYFKRRREPIPGRRSIHDRGQTIDSRAEFGHWEGDLMQFRTQRGNLVTLVERQTRLTLAAGLPSKTAEATAAKLTDIFSGLPEPARRSITFDNGSEFAQHQKLETELGMLTLLLRPPFALAARLHRERKRRPQTRPATQDRVHRLQRPRHPGYRLGQQHHTKKEPRLSNPGRGIPTSAEVLHLICESSPCAYPLRT
jgi:hypothetical protein